MNRKGQIGVGLIITLTMAAIIGLVLLVSIADNVETGTRANSGAITVSNQTITAVLNTNYILSGQSLSGTPIVTNESTGATVSSANYTIGTCVRSTDGLKGICYRATGTGQPSATGKINVTYSYYPEGYIDDAGGRAIAAIIVLLTCIAIALVFLPGIRDVFE